jgi:hypothetical protein
MAVLVSICPEKEQTRVLHFFYRQRIYKGLKFTVVFLLSVCVITICKANFSMYYNTICNFVEIPSIFRDGTSSVGWTG